MVGGPQPREVVRILWGLAAAPQPPLPRLRPLRAPLRSSLRLGRPLHRPGQPRDVRRSACNLFCSIQSSYDLNAALAGTTS